MSNKDSGTTPSEPTRTHEQAEATKAHQADRPPTREEESAAPGQADRETQKDFKEMAERGARVQGEGQLP